MPQMMPTNWLFIMLITLMMLYMNMIMIHYFYQMTPNHKLHLKKILIKWKWLW